MNPSRRQFLSCTSVSALALPAWAGAGVNGCDAAPAADSTVDLSMGYPQGALRMGFNENALGPSPKAIVAARIGIAHAHRYALSQFLQPLIAAHHGIEKEWILLGNGSTELLMLAPVTFLRDGGNVVAAVETWDLMLSVANHLGACVRRIQLVPDKGFAYDLDRMMAAVDADTRLFMLVSPNNPTGTSVDYTDLQRIAGALPKKALFILDQAYADYLPGGKTGIDLIREGYRNVLVTRTFSKAHALAGLRCGYAIGHPDILKEMSKFGCGAGNINVAVFGAVEGSLSDPAHIERSRIHVQKCRSYYMQQCKALGLEMVAGAAPFALLKVGADRSKTIKDELQKRRIFISHGSTWNLPEYLRVSYGRDAENQTFFKELATLI